MCKKGHENRAYKHHFQKLVKKWCIQKMRKKTRIKKSMQKSVFLKFNLKFMQKSKNDKKKTHFFALIPPVPFFAF